MKNSTKKIDIRQPYLFEIFDYEDKCVENEILRKKVQKLLDDCEEIVNDPKSWLNCAI